MLHPTQLRIGDLVPFGGVYFPVTDMRAGPGGTKVLRFEAHEPWTATGPTLAYRPIDFNARAGSLRYVRTR
ncbi:hypothetical protein AB0J38_32965 [Streptomyces sp. NPDC050095]|uniref:hypothetical protein n=1 Tax=unclassified Streptomyces TaxID=2593676 RepID=UPI003419FEB8